MSDGRRSEPSRRIALSRSRTLETLANRDCHRLWLGSSPVGAQNADAVIEKEGIGDAVLMTRPGIADFGDLTLHDLVGCASKRPLGADPREVSIINDGNENYRMVLATPEGDHTYHFMSDGKIAYFDYIDMVDVRVAQGP